MSLWFRNSYNTIPVDAAASISDVLKALVAGNFGIVKIFVILFSGKHKSLEFFLCSSHLVSV